MLHVSSNVVSARKMAPPTDETLVSLATAFSSFKRHALVIAGTVAAFLVVATLQILMTPPSYVASAKVLIESEKARPTWQEFGADVNVDSAAVESQAEVLRSSSVAQEVISTLGLTDDPEFVNGSADDKMGAATVAFRDRLSVRRVGQSNAIEVVFSSSSPSKAARVANEVVSAYLAGSWRDNKRPGTFRRFNDELNRASLAVTNAQVITAAMPPLGKSAPRISLILAFSCVSGLLAGMGLALCLDRFDSRVRDLAPIGDSGGAVPLPPLPIADRALASERLLALAAVNHPFSKFGDALRAIRTTLDRTAEGPDQKCIGVTPVNSGAGASSIAANLAALYARSGKRVLLLDLDFGSAALSRLFAPHAAKGLIEQLRSPEVCCLMRSERYGFAFLPMVDGARIPNVSDFTRSPEMTALMRKARAEFDIIVVDLPPPMDDGAVMGIFPDRMIFVAEYRKTRIAELTTAIARAGDHSNLVLLNKCGEPALASQVAVARQWCEAATSSFRASLKRASQRVRSWS